MQTLLRHIRDNHRISNSGHLRISLLGDVWYSLYIGHGGAASGGAFVGCEWAVGGLGNFLLRVDLFGMLNGNSFGGFMGLFSRQERWGVVFADAIRVGGLFA